MTRRRIPRCAFVLLAFAVASLAACSSEPRPAAEPAPLPPNAVAQPRMVLERVTEVGPVREPTPAELPVAEDFIPEAEQQITAATFRAELDAIEKEMNAEER